MSLNGLDAVNVSQAYEAAIVEAGGWFLLKYTTRDEVDIHKSGSGGPTEIKEAIAQYEDKSPLYGLLLYRRKKVLLKYVPEGTSRLLQARLAVHLQSVIEHFPHDALISLESSAELTDAALSSSVSALKTSGSIRSLNSIKRKRLTEIAEDASEIPIPDTPAESPSIEINDPILTGEPHKQESEQPIDHDDNASTSTTKAVQELTEHSNAQDEPLARPSEDLPGPQGRPSLAISERSIGSKSLHHNFAPSSDSFAYLYKSKVKLAPRPVTDSRHSSPYMRPTSSLPTGIQLQIREEFAMPPPPRSQGPPQTAIPLPYYSERNTNGFPPPPMSSYNPSTTETRPVSRGSAATVPANIRHAEESTMTPEKRRLMKALQKRKQQQKARQLAKQGNFDEEEESHVEKPAKKTSSKKLQKSRPTSSSGVQNAEQLKMKETQPEEVVSNIQANTPIPAENVESENTRPRSTIRIVTPSTDTLPAETREEANPVESINEQMNEPMRKPFSILDVEESQRKALPPSPPRSDLQNDTIEDIPATSERGSIPQAEPKQHIPAPAGSSSHDLLRAAAIVGADASDQETTALAKDPEASTTSVTRPISNPDRKSGFIPIALQHDVDPHVEHGPSSEHAVGLEQSALEPTTNSSFVAPIEQKDAVGTDEPPTQIPGSVVARSMVAEETLVSRDPIVQALSDTGSTTPQAHTEALATPEEPADHSSSLIGEPTDRPINTPDELDSQPKLKLATESTTLERKSRPPPISTPVTISHRTSASISKAPSLSDQESLLDEMEDATVQEATSIVLAKTPTTPFAPSISRSDTSRQTPSYSEEIVPPTPAVPAAMALKPSPSPEAESLSSVPSRTATPDVMPSLSRPSTRDVSPSAYASPFGNFVSGSRQGSLSPTGPELERPSSRKSAVSSLISQRIKAFEDKFNSSNSTPQAPPSAVKAQIVTLRKVSLNTPPPSAGLQQSSSGRSTPSGYPTPATTPHSLAQRFGFGRSNKKENVPKVSSPTDLTAKDTVSKLNKGVTDSLPSIAIQDEQPSSPMEAKAKRSFFSSSKSKKKKSLSLSSAAAFQKESRLSADTLPNPGPAASPRNSTSSDAIGRSRSPSSTESLASNGEKKDSKKKTGLLKRLSTLGGGSHRSIAETMNETSPDPPAAKTNEAQTGKKWTSAVTLGDLNVQYPDTLLWKRKFVEIDTQGFVILAPAQVDQYSKVAVKRYHMSDFRSVYMPEPDQEELPYSVNLDFQDGSTIQCACEGYNSQQRVHQALAAARVAFNT